jgi:hypothetical protein
MFDPTAITRDPAETGGVSTLKRDSSFTERARSFEESAVSSREIAASKERALSKRE